MLKLVSKLLALSLPDEDDLSPFVVIVDGLLVFDDRNNGNFVIL